MKRAPWKEYQETGNDKMSIVWKTGAAAERFRHDLKIKKALKDGAYKRWKKLLKQKQQAASSKLPGRP